MPGIEPHLEVAPAEAVDGRVQLPERAKQEKDGEVGRGSGCGIRCIGDRNVAGSAGLGADLVVASTVVSDEFQGRGKLGDRYSGNFHTTNNS